LLPDILHTHRQQKRPENLVPTHPEEKPPENKIQKSGKLFEAEECSSTHHNPPANHHKLTTKTPPKKRTFPKTPLKNARKVAENSAAHHT
jgi:hypothetical protein